MNGTLDEVQIYDRALPQDEIPMERDDIYVVNSA